MNRATVSSASFTGLRRLAPLFIVFFLLLRQTIVAQDGQAQICDPHKVFIKFREGVQLLKLMREPHKQASKSVVLQEASELTSFRATLGITNLRPVKPDATLDQLPGGLERLFVASLNDTADIAHSLSAVRANNDVEYAEPVVVSRGGNISSQVVEPSPVRGQSLTLPNDWYFSSQWDLHNTGQFDGIHYGIRGADINVIPAWNITTGSGDVLVAFLSTGLLTNQTEMTNLKDGGYRVHRGYNFVADNSDFSDDNGIGSTMVGIAAATGNNAYGIAGVDWKCQILPVKVVDANLTTSSDWFAYGLIYAADQGANVICLGWGGKLDGSAINDAITYASSRGAIIVSGVTAVGSGYFNSYLPAFDRVILVGSVDNQDKRYLSPYGRVDFMAPGNRNLGLWKNEGAYGNLSGPLGAAPLVTGAISLMLSLNNTLTFDEVFDILKASAADQVGWSNEDTPGWDQYYGWGRVDAYRALRGVLEQHPGGNRSYGNGASQNYPNPFNPGTTIEYMVPRFSDLRLVHVSLKVYSIIGQLVATIVDEMQAGGYHHARWIASCPSGVYFYRLQVGDWATTKKMILAK